MDEGRGGGGCGERGRGELGWSSRPASESSSGDGCWTRMVDDPSCSARSGLDWVWLGQNACRSGRLWPVLTWVRLPPSSAHTTACSAASTTPEKHRRWSPAGLTLYFLRAATRHLAAKLTWRTSRRLAAGFLPYSPKSHQLISVCTVGCHMQNWYKIKILCCRQRICISATWHATPDNLSSPCSAQRPGSSDSEAGFH